jgi:hypothetical protein
LPFERRCAVKGALVAVVAVLLLVGSALADIPKMVGYQGMVTDNSGNPVADGTYTMRFRIYTAVTGGTLLWDSNNQSVTLAGGVFSVMLGESPQPALGLDFDQDYWLLVTFSGQNQSPRKRLGSVGYAYMASGVVPGTLIEGTVLAGSYSALRASNTATSGSNYGIRGQSASTSGVGVYGVATAATGTNYGGRFYSSSTGGRGVYAYTTATTGSTRGVYGWSASASGSGVYGHASATTGTNYGVYGSSSSASGRGVYGRAYTSTGYNYGVYGETSSSVGRAVYGEATNTVGYSYGVYGRAASTAGTGVFGWVSHTAADGSGVYGLSDSWQAPGVTGVNTDTYGGCGVLGKSPQTGGYFEDTNSGSDARVGHSTYKVQGSGSVSFAQNHPADGSRVVVYACPEGDEVATYTRGTARLVGGEARVPLGETFKWVTNPDIGLTAHLTPRGNCHGLYVESLRTDEMVVRELGGGASDVAFDYIVYGLRIGFEEVAIVQQKQQEAYIPSMEDHRMAYAEHPDLRQYNALERFKRMTAAAGLEGSVDLTSSRALRGAIEEFDPAVHGSAGADELRELKLRMEAERRRLEEEHARTAEVDEGHSPDSPLGE